RQLQKIVRTSANVFEKAEKQYPDAQAKRSLAEAGGLKTLRSVSKCHPLLTLRACVCVTPKPIRWESYITPTIWSGWRWPASITAKPSDFVTKTWNRTTASFWRWRNRTAA